jgi:hypothetical protein
MGSDGAAQWKRKVRPSLLELAAVYKEYVSMYEQSKHMSPQERAKFYGKEPDEKTKKAMYDKLNQLASDEDQAQAAAGNAFYAASLSAAENQPVSLGDYEVSYKTPEGNPENPNNRFLLGMAEFISQQRFGRPLHQLIAEDAIGVRESSEQMQRIFQDCHHLRYGVEIQPPKGKMHHRVILDFGMGRGIENLTEEELASFFDDFCPICKKMHDPDSLGEQRKALKEQREAAISWRPEGINPTKKYTK